MLSISLVIKIKSKCHLKFKFAFTIIQIIILETVSKNFYSQLSYKPKQIILHIAILMVFEATFMVVVIVGDAGRPGATADRKYGFAGCGWLVVAR